VTSLWSQLRRGRSERAGGANETTPVTIYDWAKMFAPGGQVNYGGINYQAFSTTSAAANFSSVVYTCQAKRTAVFSEARFTWQRLRDGRPQPQGLFGTPELRILEEPWRGAHTRDLLAVAEMDSAIYGNSYWVFDENGQYLVRIDPNHVKLVTEAALDPVTGWKVGERLVAYAVTTDRRTSIYPPENIAHYKPIPAAGNQFVGQSWIGACLPDIDADHMLTDYKLSAIRNGANLTTVVNLDPNLTPTQFDDFVEKFKETHRGPVHAGEPLFLQGGSDVKTVGQTFEQLALKATQGSGETRIAAAAQVHPVLLGLSEGLAGSSLNAGNYQSAKQGFVDGTMCPAWGAFCEAFSSLLTIPGGSRLWYDARDIPFLRQELAAQMDAIAAQTQAVTNLVREGFDPDSAVRYVQTGDIAELYGSHSGMLSVQLHTPGASTGAGGSSGMAGAADAAAMLQKLYMAVGKVITMDEARRIITQATGTDLQPVDSATVFADLPPSASGAVPAALPASAA
jgi:Phage portal protein